MNDNDLENSGLNLNARQLKKLNAFIEEHYLPKEIDEVISWITYEDYPGGGKMHVVVCMTMNDEILIEEQYPKVLDDGTRVSQ